MSAVKRVEIVAHNAVKSLECYHCSERSCPKRDITDDLKEVCNTGIRIQYQVGREAILEPIIGNESNY
jgi:hypothetical protein